MQPYYNNNDNIWNNNNEYIENKFPSYQILPEEEVIFQIWNFSMYILPWGQGQKTLSDLNIETLKMQAKLGAR